MSPVPQPDEERDRPSHDTTNTDMEDIDHPDVVINADSSNSDDDDVDDDYGGYMGYQALAQDTFNNDSDKETEETDDAGDTEFSFQTNSTDMNTQSDIKVPEGVLQQVRQQDYPNTPNLPNYMQVPDAPRPEKRDLLWNQPRHANITMDTGQMDKIKSVMSGIQLPSTNIPDWAKALSDDQWKAQVVNKLVGTSQEQEVGISSNEANEKRHEIKHSDGVSADQTMQSDKTVD